MAPPSKITNIQKIAEREARVLRKVRQTYFEFESSPWKILAWIADSRAKIFLIRTPLSCLLALLHPRFAAGGLGESMRMASGGHHGFWSVAETKSFEIVWVWHEKTLLQVMRGSKLGFCCRCLVVLLLGCTGVFVFAEVSGCCHHLTLKHLELTFPRSPSWRAFQKLPVPSSASWALHSVAITRRRTSPTAPISEETSTCPGTDVLTTSSEAFDEERLGISVFFFTKRDAKVYQKFQIARNLESSLLFKKATQHLKIRQTKDWTVLGLLPTWDNMIFCHWCCLTCMAAMTRKQMAFFLEIAKHEWTSHIWQWNWDSLSTNLWGVVGGRPLLRKVSDAALCDEHCSGAQE